LRVGLLTPARLSPGALRVADSLLKSSVGLTAIIGVRWVPPSRPSERSFLRRLKSFLGPLRRAGGSVGEARAYGVRHGLSSAIVPTSNHPRTAEVLTREGLDVVVSYGAGILRPILLDLPMTFLNAHAGRLPEYGGMNVVEWAVFNDDPIWGTVHRIGRGIDTGDILLECPLDLEHPRTIEHLRSAAFASAWDMVPESLARLSRGELQFRKQREDRPRIQWFRMHERLRAIVEAKLAAGAFDTVQARSLRSAVAPPAHGALSTIPST